jgi:hypothetical protein
MMNGFKASGRALNYLHKIIMFSIVPLLYLLVDIKFLRIKMGYLTIN